MLYMCCRLLRKDAAGTFPLAAVHALGGWLRPLSIMVSCIALRQLGAVHLARARFAGVSTFDNPWAAGLPTCNNPNVGLLGCWYSDLRQPSMQRIAGSFDYDPLAHGIVDTSRSRYPGVESLRHSPFSTIAWRRMYRSMDQFPANSHHWPVQGLGSFDGLD